MPPAEMRQIIVDGKVWRGERYPNRSCSEWLIRGPFAGGTCWKPGGGPKFVKKHVAAFKVVGKVARKTNRRFSKRQKERRRWIGDPSLRLWAGRWSDGV